MSAEFSNLAQATLEDRAALTNLTTVNSTLMEQVAMYTNNLSTKEADNMALQTTIRNLQGELKNLKAKMYSPKKSGQFSSNGAANKDNGRVVPQWKREVHFHHPNWWSTTYCWSHGAGVHTVVDCNNKRLTQGPGHRNNKIGRQYFRLTTGPLTVRVPY